MERKNVFFKECIAYLILLGSMVWVFSNQIKLLQINFKDLTAENTAVITGYIHRSQEGRLYDYPIYEMELGGRIYRHESFLPKSKEGSEREIVKYNPTDPSEFYSERELKCRERGIHSFWWVLILAPNIIIFSRAQLSIDLMLYRYPELNQLFN